MFFLSDTSVPFGQWTKEQVCGWLEDFGLGQYVNLSRQWVESGQTLLSATPQDLEKVRGKSTKQCGGGGFSFTEA